MSTKQNKNPCQSEGFTGHPRSFFWDLYQIIHLRFSLIPQVTVLSLFFLFEFPSTAQAGQSSPARQSDPAARLYADKCSACHTVGAGELVGPDLLPSTEWAPEELAKGVRRMDENVGPLSNEEVRLLVELLKDPEVTSRIEADQRLSELESAASGDPASAETGGRLFYGDLPLENGGIACASCHRVGSRGGTLAADLTDSFSRLGKSALLSGIEQASFKVMRAAYAAHPVTRQEALHLVSFLETSQELSASLGGEFPLFWVGAGGALLFFGFTGVFYRNRNPGTRRRLVQQSYRR